LPSQFRGLFQAGLPAAVSYAKSVITELRLLIQNALHLGSRLGQDFRRHALGIGWR
jgi:hypothetical protein